MHNLSSKQICDHHRLYENIYKEQPSIEDEFDNILAIKLYNALIEDGLITGDLITEDNIDENLITRALAKAPKVLDVVKSVAKQVTGVGTKPTTKTGQVVRDLQKVTTGVVAANPEARGRLVGGVTGAVQGAYQGVTKQPEGPSIGDRIKAFQNPPRRAPIN